MPAKRKTYRPKAPIRKKRKVQFRPNRTLVPRNYNNRVFSYKFRLMENQLISNSSIGGAASDVHGTYKITIGTLPNIQSYLRLYRQYRINKVKIEFLPAVTNKVVEEVTAVPGTTVDNVRPLFATALNRTDTDHPLNISQIMSQPSAKYVQAGRYHMRYFTPNTFDSVYRPSVANALNPEYKQWIRTNDSGITGDVEHQGLDWVMQGAPGFGDGMFKYRVIITAYVQFKGMKRDSAL